MTAGLRRLDPPHPVEVLHDGQRVARAQDARVRRPNGECRASVAYSVVHDRGPGKHLRSLPTERCASAPA